MKFLTADECKRWSAAHGFGSAPSPTRSPSEPHEIMIPVAPLWPRTTWFARFLSLSAIARGESLLWVTLWGVWPSSENLPLFGRVRDSFAEGRPLQDAPGHLFERSELDDLASFVQLCLICVWDFHVLPATTGVRAFASHDEFVHLYVRNPASLDELRADLTAADAEFSVVQ